MTYGIMVRTKCDDPAICHVCQRDFSNNGNKRYWCLKRHIESRHPTQIIKNNTQNNSNCFVNNGTVENNIILTNVGESDIKKLLDEDTMKIIRERMGTIDGNLPKLALVIFDKFHCNPKYPEDCNLVIPNLNKNEIWAKTPKGTKILTREAGVQLALDTLYKPGGDLHQVVTTINEPKLYSHLKQEKITSEEDDDKTNIENLLKTTTPSLRANIVKYLKKDF